MIDNYSLKPQDIRFQLVTIDSICLTLYKSRSKTGIFHRKIIFFLEEIFFVLLANGPLYWL